MTSFIREAESQQDLTFESTSRFAEVRSGAFVRQLMADYDAGSPDLLARRKALGQRPIEAVGRHLGVVASKAKG